MDSFDKKRKGTGTREWSEHSVNLGTGCRHGCLYCYARTAAARFGKLDRPENWTTEVLNPRAVRGGFGKRKGVTMFPTTHDITWGYLPAAKTVLGNLLRADRHNQVLIVSKPNVSIIHELCRTVLYRHREQVQFRFTIGSTDDATLRFWEPGAPSLQHRIDSLVYVVQAGYKASISIEPMLGPPGEVLRLVELYGELVESIWIGKMNRPVGRTRWIHERRPDVKMAADAVMCQQRDDNLLHLVRTLVVDPKVRWKDSMHEIVNRVRVEQGGQG